MGATSSAKGSSTPDYETIPAGPVAGRCCAVIELGTHANTHPQAKAGSVKTELMIIWETNEIMEDGRPFTVNWRGTNSLSDKAILKKMLESWRGKAFTAAELERFELKNILNAPCLLNVVHTQGKKDKTKTYANVGSVMPLPKGMVANPLTVEPLDFGIGDIHNAELFDRIWPWVQNIIKESFEGKGIDPETGKPVGQQEGQHAAGSEPSFNHDDDDDIPF